MALDLVVWSILNLVVVHGSDVIRIYYDERRIEFETEEFEMLWRFLYRHSGLSKAQFQALVLPNLQLQSFREGGLIPCQDHFYIILDGMVLSDIVHEDHPSKKHKIRLASGDMFPLLHIYKNYIPRKAIFHRSAIRNPVVETHLLRAFCIPLKQMEEMASHPRARAAWTAMLIAATAEIAERQYTNSFSSNESLINESRTAKRMSSTENLADDNLNSKYHPLFRPLSASEEPDPLLAGAGGGLSKPLRHAWRYMELSVYMPWVLGGRWPVGLRHSLMPPTEALEPHEREEGVKCSYGSVYE